MNQSRHDTNVSEAGRWLLSPMLELAGLLREQTAWTWLHSGRVGRYSVAFGKKLGLSREQMMALQSASLLHDVGKVAVPPEVLDKSGKLTRDEWYTITKHSMASSLMLKALQLPRQVISIAQSHHEWYNGKGYPLGLEGEGIPLGARILSIADAYDAMNSDRPYRAALKPSEIAEELEKGAGTQFDPALVRELMPLIVMDPEAAIPRRRLRVVSDDQELFRQLWFATYPLGWEMEVWPPTWADGCPSELLALAGNGAAKVEFTIIDGRSAKRIPGTKAADMPGTCLWIDPVETLGPSLLRPLDFAEILDFVDVHPDDMLGLSRKEKPIRVLLADPFQLFRQVLRRCLDERPEVQVVAEAKSPREYRKALAAGNYDMVIVASDLFQGTQSTAPLRADDWRLGLDEIHGVDDRHPAIVLVADEDLESAVTFTTPRGEDTNRVPRAHVHRGAPVEVLIETMSELLKRNAN